MKESFTQIIMAGYTSATSVAPREGLEETSALCKQFKRVCSKLNEVNLW